MLQNAPELAVSYTGWGVGTVGGVADHYEVLGIAADASGEQVRHAYRRLVKAAHPDRSGDTERFHRITEAYKALSDPDQRAAYDARQRPAATAVGAPARPGRPDQAPPVPAPLPRLTRPPRWGRWVAVLVVVVIGGAVWRGAVTAPPALGDDCLVGAWRGEAFEVPFRGTLMGREVTAPIRGGAGATLAVSADGRARSDYTGSSPLVGSQAGLRIEALFTGTVDERWRAQGGRLEQAAIGPSDVELRATIDGRPTDRPVAVDVVSGEYPYTCTATALELGPYRYTRS